MGLTGIALTDHDTFGGMDALFLEGKKRELNVYAGVEISCMDTGRKRPVHILGYELDDIGRKQLEVFLKPLRSSMTESVERSASALKKAGYPVEIKKIYEKAGPEKNIFKQLIMEQLMEAGLCQEMYGRLYRELFKTDKNGRIPLAKLYPYYEDPKKIVSLIYQMGGAAVLAHPGQYDSYELVPELVEVGLAGIEAFHPLHGEKDIKRSIELAKRYNLKITGGSDYHGKYGEGEQLGECGVESWPF